MRRAVLGLGLLVAALVAVLLLWIARGDREGGGTTAGGDEASRPVTAPHLAAPGPRPSLTSAALGERKLPPPPPDFHAGPMRELPSSRLRKLASGEFPLLPPAIADDQRRAEFRRWWVDEYARRAEIYRRERPSDTHPSDEETRAMIAQLYDLGEPPRPGETAEAYEARRQAWFERWRDFTAAYGTPPKTVISFGGDAQFGAGEPIPDVPGGDPLEPDTSRPTLPDDAVVGDSPAFGPAKPR